MDICTWKIIDFQDARLRPSLVMIFDISLRLHLRCGKNNCRRIRITILESENVWISETLLYIGSKRNQSAGPSSEISQD